jgi:hypothetical protein
MIGAITRRKIEFISSVQLIVFGFWLLLPINTFHTTNAYAFIADFGEEWMWGIIPFLAGLIWLFASSYKLRGILAVLGITYWLIMTIVFICGNPYSTAVSTYFVNAIITAMAYNEVNKEGRRNAWILRQL